MPDITKELKSKPVWYNHIRNILDTITLSVLMNIDFSKCFIPYFYILKNIYIFHWGKNTYHEYTHQTNFCVHNTVLLTIGKMVYSISLEHSHLASFKMYAHIIAISHFCLSLRILSLITIIPISYSICLTILVTSYKSNHSVFILWLILLSMMSSQFIMLSHIAEFPCF